MVTLHEVITFLVSMQISISSLQTHNVNRCGRSRHLARKLSLRRRSEERFSRNAETDLVCRLLLEKKKDGGREVDEQARGVRHRDATERRLQIVPQARPRPRARQSGLDVPC